MLFRAISGDSNPQSPGPANDFWYEPVNVSATGVRITAMSAMRASSCYACIKVLAETVATLPRTIYQRLPNGDIAEARTHPLQDVIDTKPNDMQTGVEFWEMQTAFGALFGNAYAEIVPGRRGFADQLVPLRPDYMRTLRMPDSTYRFEYTDPLTLKKKIYLPEELFRIPGFSFNGVEGIAPIFFANDPIGLALATEAFGCKFFSKDATPALVLEHPNALTPEAIKNIKETWGKAHSGLENAFSVAVLEEGMKVNPLGVPNKDSQFLETRRYQIAEIARYFRIPLHMINELDKATYSNIEQQSIEFLKYTIRPQLRRIEQRVNSDLILRPDIFYLKHNTDDLLMGEIAVRYAAFASGINAGWLTRNEARKKEGLNPLPGLDEPLTPMNLGGDKPMTPPVEKKPQADARLLLENHRIGEPVLHDAFERILSAERAAVSTMKKKYAADILTAKVGEFYSGKHREYVARTLAPCQRLCQALQVSAPDPVTYAEFYVTMRLTKPLADEETAQTLAESFMGWRLEDA
jgi:HK97 family phage portal protein